MALSQDHIEEFIRAFRKVGLYEGSVKYLPIQEGDEERDVLIIDFIVGDLAFDKRVQSPEELAIDQQFGALARQIQREIAADFRAEVAQNKNPFEEN